MRRMFSSRRIVLQAAVVLVGLIILMVLDIEFHLLTERGQQVVLSAMTVPLAVIAVGTLVTSYYVFRVGLCEDGFKYALGHMVLCLALAEVALIGIVLVPVLVRNDIERWHRAEDRLSEG